MASHVGNGNSSFTMNACLACRRVKMKCHLREGQTKCDRCDRKTIECVFQQHRRGRKPGTRISKRSGISNSSRVTFQRHTSNRPPERRAHSPIPIVDTVVDVDARQISTSDSSSLQPSGLLNSEAMRSGRFSLQNILGNSRLDSEQEASTVPTQDPVRNGLISEPMATFLFESFMNVLNPYISQLDPTLHTFAYTRRKSHFLLTAILAVSAKNFNTALYKPLLKHAEDLFVESFRRGTKCTETAQAILILTYWKEPDDTRTWLNLGYVIRMGMDLGWHRFRVRTTPGDASEMERRKTRNEERTWFVLFVYDRSISLQTSKPWMMERTNFIEGIEHWCKDPLATENDVLLGAFVTLRLLTSEVFKLLGSWRQMDSSPNMSSFLTMISNRIDEWEDKWLPLCLSESESCHYFLVRFYGAHLRLQLYALPLQEALQSNDDRIKFHLDTLWASVSSAVSMLKLVSQFSSRLYFAQDSVHVMTAYSAAFLVKVLLSVPANIARSLELTVIETIRTAATTLSQQSAPPGSSISLQHDFLQKIMLNYDEIITQRNLRTGKGHIDSRRTEEPVSGRASTRNYIYLGSSSNNHSSPAFGSQAAVAESSSNATDYGHGMLPMMSSDTDRIPLHFPEAGLDDNNSGFLGSGGQQTNLADNDAWTDVFTAAGFTIHDGFPFT